MAVELIVGNVPYQYPEPGESPGWGEGATGWAEKVTEVLQSIVNANDILETAFTVDNNIAAATNVTSLAFNTTSVRAAEIDYSIYRATDAPTELTETGKMLIVYKNTANTWFLTRTTSGDDTGVEFTITTTGQIQYTSTDISGANYTGIMKFRAKSLQQ